MWFNFVKYNFTGTHVVTKIEFCIILSTTCLKIAQTFVFAIRCAKFYSCLWNKKKYMSVKLVLDIVVFLIEIYMSRSRKPHGRAQIDCIAPEIIKHPCLAHVIVEKFLHIIINHFQYNKTPRLTATINSFVTSLE